MISGLKEVHSYPQKNARRWEQGNLYIDQRAVIRPRIGVYRQPRKGEPWKIEEVIGRIPFRADLRINEEQANTSARLAILYAEEKGLHALNRERGKREAAQVARRGYPAESVNMDGVTVRRPLRDVIADLEQGSDSPFTWFGENLGRRIGVNRQEGEGDAALAKRIRAASRQNAGRVSPLDACVFAEHLARWWFRVTGKRPSQRLPNGPHNPNRKARRNVGFAEFAVAAWQDVGGDGHIHRLIQPVVAGLSFPLAKKK
jgi:hypothetical protein